MNMADLRQFVNYSRCIRNEIQLRTLNDSSFFNLTRVNVGVFLSASETK